MDNVRVKLTFDRKCLKYSEHIPAHTCWLLVDKSLKTIQDIEEKIRERYYVKKDVELFVESCHLPTWESARILRENDNILVRIRRKHQQIKENVTFDLLELAKQQKNKVTEIPDPKNSKRKRDHETAEVQECHEAVFFSSGSSREKSTDMEKNDSVKVIDMDVVVNITDETVSQAMTQNGTEAAEPVDETKRKRRKRTRSRKRNRTADVGTDSIPQSQHSSDKSSSINGSLQKMHITARSHNVRQVNNNTVGHIHFSDEDDDNQMEDTEVSHDYDTNAATEPAGSQEFTANMTSECEAVSISNFNRTPSTTETVLRKMKNAHIQEEDPAVQAFFSETFQSDDVPSEGAEVIQVKTTSTPVSTSNIRAMQSSSSFTQQSPEKENDVLDILKASYNDESKIKTRKKQSPADLVKNAAVFNRKNMKRQAYCPLSKAQQLASKQENISMILQNKGPIGRDDSKAKPKSVFASTDFHSFAVIKDPPKAGQIIAFKMLELTSNFTPEVSDFKVGKILTYEQDKKCLELELLEGTVGGVMLDMGDNADDIQKFVTVQWTSLLEPRIIED